jgi:hypothetical protein
MKWPKSDADQSYTVRSVSPKRLHHVMEKLITRVTLPLLCLNNPRNVKKEKGKIFLALNKLSTTPERLMGEWRYSSTILDFGTR